METFYNNSLIKLNLYSLAIVWFSPSREQKRPLYEYQKPSEKIQLINDTKMDYIKDYKLRGLDIELLRTQFSYYGLLVTIIRYAQELDKTCKVRMRFVISKYFWTRVRVSSAPPFREVVQLGQNASFGNQRSQVRILSSRPV